MRKARNKGYEDRYQDYDEEQYYEDYPDPHGVSVGIERVRRKLLRLMIISVIITILLVGAVLVAVIYKITYPADQTAGNAFTSAETAAPAVSQPPGIEELASAAKPVLTATIEGEIILPTGTRLLSQSISGKFISLETLQPNGGTELIVYDYQAQRVVARLRIPVDEAAATEEETQGNSESE